MIDDNENEIFKKINSNISMLWNQQDPISAIKILKDIFSQFITIKKISYISQLNFFNIHDYFFNYNSSSFSKIELETVSNYIKSIYDKEATASFKVYSTTLENINFCFLNEEKTDLLLYKGFYIYDTSSYAIDIILNQFRIFKKQSQKLDTTQSLLYLDDLTGVYNTRYLSMILDSEIKRCSRFKEEFCLLFLDLDEFKKVNDYHGHLTGSSILIQTAKVLKNSLRQIDSIIRYGGDEFVILLLNTSIDQGYITAERLRKTIEETSFYSKQDNKEISLTVSIGVTYYPGISNKEDLLKIADEAMYMSKKSGKNKLVVWDKNILNSDNTTTFVTNNIKKDYNF